MNFDCIIANPPYGKIGCDIVNKIMHDVPHKDISILGTSAMLGKHNEHLALEYVYIEDFILNPLAKCKWVQQVILLGHKGNCKAIPAEYRHGRTIQERPREIRIAYNIQGSGIVRQSLNATLTRNRETSITLSISDEDYEYIKQHWDGMNIIERFWWLHDHGLYKRFVEQ